jgi:hypothetical protein
MSVIEIHLPDDQTIEQILLSQKKEVFPPFSKEKGEISYPDKYKNVKKELIKVHNSVERGAMASELEKYIQEKSSVSDSDFRRGLESALIYLNNHGKDHVDKVIEKVSEILRYFPQDKGLTPYEMFVLLCAIQIHDTGNTFGREKHEQVIGTIFDKECSKIIPNNFERKGIVRIAMVHGGEIFGNKDTIKILSSATNYYNFFSVRERLLAALLRFADELADDISRADRYGIESEKIPEHSKIFHYYSQSLHTVAIVGNPQSSELHLELIYDFDSTIAKKKFIRENSEKYLIDEIYDRTIKMEKERRYCMRYLRPYFYLSSIKVDIKITDINYALISKDIGYILEEEGYPSTEIEIKERLSGSEIVNFFEPGTKESKND